MTFDRKFLDEAVRLSREHMQNGDGGPFGAVVVKNDAIIARGHNQVTTKNDPTAHAEVVAIRNACQVLGTFQLEGCDVYSSCEPCPMCLSALYWARPGHVYYATTRDDAARAGFDDSFIYDELARPAIERRLVVEHRPHDDAARVFEAWKNKADKVRY